MKVAVTGGTGLVGRFIVEEALRASDSVSVYSRNAPPAGFFSAPVQHSYYDLAADVPLLTNVDVLIHAAFSHLPGRYRGGEGGDPDGFLHANLDGSGRLFRAAKDAGVKRVVFLSSRAVYGTQLPGATLTEKTDPRPDTLYGRMKLEAEQALSDLASDAFVTGSIRATGVYGAAGPGQRHKWQDLFDAFLCGDSVASRVATEVHGDDLADAVRLLICGTKGQARDSIWNASDILLDRHDLLAEVQRLTAYDSTLPDRADASDINRMSIDPLQSLGWTPGGMAKLRTSLPNMLA